MVEENTDSILKIFYKNKDKGICVPVQEKQHCK